MKTLVLVVCVLAVLVSGVLAEESEAPHVHGMDIADYGGEVLSAEALDAKLKELEDKEGSTAIETPVFNRNEEAKAATFFEGMSSEGRRACTGSHPYTCGTGCCATGYPKCCSSQSAPCWTSGCSRCCGSSNCCSSSESCCSNGGCCASGSTCCSSGCCPSGTTCCGTKCCNPGYVCSGGSCVSSSSSSSGSSSGSGSGSSSGSGSGSSSSSGSSSWCGTWKSTGSQSLLQVYTSYVRVYDIYDGYVTCYGSPSSYSTGSGCSNSNFKSMRFSVSCSALNSGQLFLTTKQCTGYNFGGTCYSGSQYYRHYTGKECKSSSDSVCPASTLMSAVSYFF